MTSVHRPLSTWVARLGADGRLGRINDGRERSDARTFSWFGSTWTRDRVAVARPGQVPQEALALVEERTGAVVVELDNYSRPLVIGAAGLAVVEETERSWPAVTEDSAWSALADEPMPVRHLLLWRLTEEAGEPLPPWVFHVLDWDRVEDLIGHLRQGFTGATVEAPPILLRHWYSPAVRGLTSALEQIDSGQRLAERDVRQEGVESLFAALRAGEPARLPRSTRRALTGLLEEIANGAPLYRFAVRSVTRELAGEPVPARLVSPLLDPQLEPAAAEENREQQTTTTEADSFELRVTRSAEGTLAVTVSVEADGEELPLFVEITLTVPADTGRNRSLWMALGRQDDQLTGTVVLPLPASAFVAGVSAVPVGAAALRYSDPADLLGSIRAGSPATQEFWLAAVDQVPRDHPVGEAGRRFEEEE